MSNIESFTFSYINNATMERDNEAKVSGPAGSWLMALAKLLGEIADKMGEQLVKLAEKIDDVQDAKANFENRTGKSYGSGDLTQLNAMMQAQAQLMNMMMQAMSTIIKSVGEGNTQIARKQ